MSNKAFQQNLDDKKGPQTGGHNLIQMLFKEPVEMPDKEKMTAIMEKHIGSTECFCYDKKMAGFAALDHVAEFQDGKCPVQLMVMKCDKFKGKGFDAFLMSQMWDCQEDRERIFRECKYQVVATDMLAAALPERKLNLLYRPFAKVGKAALMLYSVPFVLAWILMLFGLTPSLPSHNFPAGMLWSSSSHWLLAG